MIDIHTHILPGIDDGAQDIYDSIEMAALAYENGTRVIVATPTVISPGCMTIILGKIYPALSGHKEDSEERGAGDYSSGRNGDLCDRGDATASVGRKDISD